MDPAPADARLSNYRLERLLGQGGMGAVYLARDLTLDRPVAIKFINPERAADPVARQRLLREARAAAALDHPNICVIHEVIDEPGGRAGIVMQYVEGETLASRLRGGPLDVRLALAIAADIASALAVAHRHNVIHRDIKPQNIVLTKDHHARLLDFGLAVQHLPSGSDDDSTQAALTLPGALAGTPAYMSPEQAQGLPLDGRSDLFSLGCVLYECLTGRRPFTGNSPFEIAHQVLSVQPPAPSSLRPELTAHHDELCLRLLAKHRDERFQSADELLGAIRVSSSSSSWSRPLAEGDRSRRTPFSRRAVTAAASIGLAAVLVFFAWWNIGAGAEPVDPQAAHWYRIGTEFIRDGAYHSGRVALEQAIAQAPSFVPAHLRLAEAHAELDEGDSAQRALLTVSRLVADRTRLPRSEQLRIEALHAVLTRDLDGAILAYKTLLEEDDQLDPGLWLDLGRVQDNAGRAQDAKASYRRAIDLDPNYAPARLRLGSLRASEGNREAALEEFGAAERLYQAASNVEGQIETLLRRGTFIQSLGNITEARRALEAARTMAAGLRSRSQEIRATIQLSVVTAWEGRFTDAERTAADAVKAAIEERFETVAADGLIDLANVIFLQADKREEALAHLEQAVAIAQRRDAKRLIARARLQQASLMLDAGERQPAIDTAQSILAFAVTHRYGRFELKAHSIIARGLEGLGRYDEAAPVAEKVLARARQSGDEAQQAEALETLAGVATAVGALPDAIRYRTAAYEIHERQNEIANLPFDLTNRAELLIRLGRPAEAVELLDAVDARANSGVEAFIERRRRAKVLRALAALTGTHYAEAARLADELLHPGDRVDSATSLAKCIQRVVAAHRRRKPTIPPEPEVPRSSAARELLYWDLFALLTAGDYPTALRLAKQSLSHANTAISPEFEWRIAAIGAAAARGLRSTDDESRLREQAAASLGALRSRWQAAADSYERRPDLVELRLKAGLLSQS